MAWFILKVLEYSQLSSFQMLLLSHSLLSFWVSNYHILDFLSMIHTTWSQLVPACQSIVKLQVFCDIPLLYTFIILYFVLSILLFLYASTWIFSLELSSSLVSPCSFVSSLIKPTYWVLNFRHYIFSCVCPFHFFIESNSLVRFSIISSAWPCFS